MNQSNHITNQSLGDRIRELEEIIDDKNNAQEAKVKKIVKENLGKLIEGLKDQGFNEKKIYDYLEGVFGKENFEKGKYKGGREIIITTIKELLGKSNWQGDKYTGGWNEEQDTANINKLFNPLKKDVEDKLGTAKKEVDTKLGGVDAKLKEADSQIKTKLEAVDIKLETADKEVKAKLKEIGSEVVKTMVVQLKDPKSEVSAELRDFLDPDNFYPTEWKEGDLFPKNRAGKQKNAKDIALMQAEHNAEIKSQQDWLDFFNEHSVQKDEDRDEWKKEFKSNVIGAKDLFVSAKSKGKQYVGEDFTKDEEFRIDKESKTPKGIDRILEDIPKQREKLIWDDFFRKHKADSRINDEETQKNWRESGMSIELADKIYAKGWNNSPNGLINKEYKIETYTTNPLINDKPYPQTTKNIDPQEHSGIEVDKIHNFIAKRIETEIDLDKFPDVVGNNLDGEVNTIKGTYDEKLVPDTRSYKKIKELRDERIKKLFKEYFQGEDANATNLTDEQIELWRTSLTGLPNTGKDQRTAFNNSWTDPSKITNGRWVEYKEVKNIEVLKYKPEQIDTAITSANKVLGDIQAFKSLRELEPTNFKDKQDIIDNLKKQTEILPVGTLDKINAEIKNAETNLFYHLDEPADGGIKLDRLNEIDQDIRQNRWTPADYAPLTTNILNSFIKTFGSKSVKIKGEKEYKNSQGKKVPFDNPNINDWLKDKGAYEIEKKTTDKEDALPLELRGSELLDFFYKKAKFSPEDLADRKSYVKTKIVEVSTGYRGKTPAPTFDGLQGHLPIGTGVGKTTKTVNCVVGGGENDELRGGKGNRVILVMPNQILVEAAAKYHSGWLQDWGCSWHGKKLDNVKCKPGTYVPATEEEIAKGEYVERKYIFKTHGKYKVVKDELLPKDQKGLSIITGDKMIGFMAQQLLLSGLRYRYEDTGEKDVDKVKIFKTVEEKLIDYDPISKFQPDENNSTGWFKTQDDIDKWRAEAESKVIDKEHDIIMFDEGDYSIPSYKALQLQVVNAGYRVIRMSATFEGQEFSITSTYPRSNLFAGWGGKEALEADMEVGFIKIDNPEQVQRLADLRKVDVSTIKWKDEKGEFIPVAVNLDERLQVGKTWLFLPSLNLTPAQQRELKDISWMNYTPEWDEYVESVSFGMPMGSLGLTTVDHGVGLSPDVDTAILGGKIAVKTLQDRFQYKIVEENNIDQANAVQEIGRVARFQVGTAILLSPKWENLDTGNDVAAAMVNALFEGEVSHIYKKGYEMIQDPIMLRVALAIPYRFGKLPEEVLIGLKVDDKTEKIRVDGKKPLTKIDWRTESEPQPDIKIMGMSFGKPDADLWDKYLGKNKPVSMKKETAKERLLENISTFIAEDTNFPEKIEVWNQSNLIDFIWGDDVKKNKGAVILEVKKVLNGVIKNSIEKLKIEDYDPSNKTSKKKEMIKKVANYYNIADAFIDISLKPKKGEEGVNVLTLQIEKPKIEKRILF